MPFEILMPNSFIDEVEGRKRPEGLLTEEIRIVVDLTCWWGDRLSPTKRVHCMLFHSCKGVSSISRCSHQTKKGDVVCVLASCFHRMNVRLSKTIQYRGSSPMTLPCDATINRWPTGELTTNSVVHCFLLHKKSVKSTSKKCITQEETCKKLLNTVPVHSYF